MACAGINNLGNMTAIKWWGWHDVLLTMKVIDDSGAGPVNSKHLNTLKGFMSAEIDLSVFSVITGAAGANAGPNARTWTMSASTASTTQWVWLEKRIGRVMQQMQQSAPLNNIIRDNKLDTLLQFTIARINGALLAGGGGGVVYVITAPLIDLNCRGPAVLNRRFPFYGGVPDDPNDSTCNVPLELLPTIITSVAYRTLNHHIYEAQAGNPFDTARRVVVEALGAVNAAALLNTIRTRQLGQSIRHVLRERNVAEYLIRGSNKKWRLVQRNENWGGVKTVEADLNANLEKVRKNVDRIEWITWQSNQVPTANDRFTVLKMIGKMLSDVLRNLPDFEKELPTTFIDRFNMLTTTLHEEIPGAYSGSELDAKLEFYRQRFNDFTNIIKENVSGWFMQINAAERSRIKAGVGELTVTGAGTGTGNETVNTVPPVPTPVPTPTDLQAGADVLSQLAVMGGQLDWARVREILPARVLRYAYLTGRVKVNGKRRFLTVVKMKESGKQTAYVAQFVEPNWGTACDPAYQ
jgi:hypothetical protein